MKMSHDDDQHRADSSADESVDLDEETRSTGDDLEDALRQRHEESDGQARSTDPPMQQPDLSTSSSSTGKRKRYSIRTTHEALSCVQYNTFYFEFFLNFSIDVLFVYYD